MADFQITGDTSDAVRALRDLAAAGQTATAALNDLKGVQTLSLAQLAQRTRAEGALIAGARLRARITKQEADTQYRQLPLIKQRLDLAQKLARNMRATMQERARQTGSFSAAHINKLQAAYIRLQMQIESTGESEKRINATRKLVAAGKFVGSQNADLRAIAATYKEIYTIDQARQAAIAKQNVALATQQEIIRQNNRTIAEGVLAQERAAIFMARTSRTPSLKGAGASQTQVNQLRAAELAYSKLAIKARLTHDQMQAMRQEALGKIKVHWALRQSAAYAAMVKLIRIEQQVADATTRAAARRTSATVAANRKAQTSYSTAQKGLHGLLLTWKSVFRLVFVQALHLTIGRLISVMFDATRQMTEFSIKISEIRTISMDSQRSTDAWSAAVLRLSSAYGRLATDVTEGVYQTLSNQVAKGTDAIIFMNQALRFSRAAVSSTAEAVNLGTAAINSFQLAASDAEPVFAQLMKTIELGRLRASEMADTYGRIGSIAHQLGVEMAQLNAMVVLFTRTGIKSNEAMTLINQLMLKLIRPTKAMRKLFAEWGVTSGRAAIQTFGWVGVLQKLEEAAAKSGDRLNEIGELFSRVRAIRAGAVLTDPVLLAKYAKDIDRVSNSMEDYQKQVREAMSSTGFLIQQQTTQFKNYIMQTISKPLLEWIANMAKGGTTLVDVFNKFKAAFAPVVVPIKLIGRLLGGMNIGLVVLITTLIALKTAWKLFGYDIATTVGMAQIKFRLLGHEVKSLQTTIYGTAAAAKVLAFSFQLLSTVAVAAIVVLIASIMQAREEARLTAEEAERSWDQYAEKLEKDRKRREKAEKESQKTTLDALRESLKKRYQAYRQHIANIQVLLDRVSASIVSGYEDALDNLKDRLKDITKAIKADLSKLESAIKRINRSISKSKADAAKFAVASKQNAFQRQLDIGTLGGDTPEKTLTKLQTQIAKVRAAYAGSIFVGNFDKARTDLDYLNKLLKQKYTLLTSITEEGLKSDLAVNKARVIAAHEKINALLFERNRLEALYRVSQAANALTKEAELAKKQAALVKLSKQFTDIQKIEIKPGDTAKQIGAKRADFANQNKAILQGLLKSGFGPAVAAPMVQRLADASAALERLAQVGERAAKIQTDLTASIKKLKDAQTANTKGIKERKDRINKISAEGSEAKTDMKTFAESFLKSFATLLTGKTVSLIGNLKKEGDRLVAENPSFKAFTHQGTFQYAVGGGHEKFPSLEVNRKKLQEKVIELYKNLAEAEPADEAAAVKSLEKLVKFIRIVSEFFRRKAIRDDIDENFVAGKFFPGRGDEVRGSTEKHLSIGQRQADVRKNIATILGNETRTKAAAAELERFVDIEEQLIKSITSQEKKLKELTEIEGNSIDVQKKLITALEDLTAKIRGQIPGVEASGYSWNPNMITPSRIRGFDSGNRSQMASTTNVGGINITVEGGDTSQETLANIANGLRRGIRRGEFSLSPKTGTA